LVLVHITDVIIIRERCLFLEAPDDGLQVSGHSFNYFFIGLHLLNNEMFSRKLLQRAARKVDL
jgi:hypothetical protein